jgi:hypothetical protein
LQPEARPAAPPLTSPDGDGLDKKGIYRQLCAENEEVRKKAKEIGLQDLDGQIAHGKSLGLEFSKEDFETAAKKAAPDGKNELSDGKWDPYW